MPAKHMIQWVDRLLNGEEGFVIVAEMRQHYSTDCSLMTRISAARRLFMTAKPSAKQSNRHPSLKASIDELKREADHLGSSHPCSDMIRDFVNADLRTMYAEWRRRPHLQHGCVHTEAVQRIFAKMRVLPANMDSFRAPTATLQECIAESEDAKLEKSETMTPIANADKILSKAAQVLKRPDEHTLSELIVALCIASGRRLGEIASPRSHFWAMARGYEHGVMFSGQLKQTKLKPLPPYAIPIIGVSAPQFLDGIKNLRSRQEHDLVHKTQSDISSLYQSNARKYLKAELPVFRKIHELRAFYAACVFRAFDWKRLSEPRVVMYILGHQNMNFFVNYNSVQLSGLTASYGEFSVEISSRTPREGRMSLGERKKAGL